MFLFCFQVKLEQNVGKPSRVIHIRNIPNETTEAEIIQLGLPFGRVTNVLVLKGKNQVWISHFSWIPYLLNDFDEIHKLRVSDAKKTILLGPGENRCSRELLRETYQFPIKVSLPISVQNWYNCCGFCGFLMVLQQFYWL